MMSHRRQPNISCSIKDLMQPFKLKNDKLCVVMERFEADLKKALSRDQTAAMKCFQTFVQDFPTGEERGSYLTLDLGGSHFRLILITFKPDQKYDTEARTYTFPEEKMTGTSEEFFDYIADCVDLFEDELKLKDKQLGLGFCFSFPVKMEGLTKAYLSYWVKQFRVSGVEGQNVVALLQAALKKKNLKISPIVLLNDTTGCLLSCSWKEHTCRVGVIIGTGANACYIEKIQNIGDFSGDPNKPYMVVNTELGNFGQSGILDDILTEFDKQVDSESKNPGIQTFEKMISALYFSELVRLTILKGIELKCLFDGETSEMLQRKRSFLPEFIYEIEGDNTFELHKTLGILEVMRFKNISIQDCVNVKYICKTICRRSASLLAAAISTIVNRMAISHVTVAYDGGVYKTHPKYNEHMREMIKVLVNPNIAVEHKLSEDGSGRGAALVVSMYMSQQGQTASLSAKSTTNSTK